MADEVKNIVVRNEGSNPLVGYNFMLRVEGMFDLPCKTVHSFTKENEYEYIQEGGLNDYVHMRRKPITKPFTFTVERYVGTDYYDPLQNGAELVLPLILLVTKHANHFEVTRRAYVFTGCTVISKEYGELDSERSGLHTEKTTISYREMMVVTMPADIPIGNWLEGDKSKNKFATTVKPAQDAVIRPGLPIEEIKKKKRPTKLWPEVSRAKQAPERDGKTPQEELVERRKKLVEDLLKVREKNKELSERRERIRRWPKVSSATVEEETQAKQRTVLPIKNEVTAPAKKSRKWPEVSSAMKLKETQENVKE